MAEDERLQFDLLKDHYENHGKSANYLLAAHGAGLIGCVSVLKDYTTTPQFKGVGVFIVIFCVGLLGSIAMYASVAISRMIALNTVVHNDQRLKSWASGLLFLNVVGLVVAVLSLVIAIVLLMWRLASL